MLTPVTAIRFDKAVGSGRTKPAILTCEHEDGSEVELIAKFAAGCDMRERSLIAEALAALLAADLDLPVPEPFLVRVESDFAASVIDPTLRGLAEKSIGWNFGSKKLPGGFSTISTDRVLSNALFPVAAEILAFDVFIANPDRSVANPNCLTNGRALAIFDHELAFLTEGIIGWKPPWEPGGIALPKGLPPRNRHVFLEEIRGAEPDFTRLSGAFDLLTPERLKAYRDALPAEWQGVAADAILSYVDELKRNVDTAIRQLTQALK